MLNSEGYKKLNMFLNERIKEEKNPDIKEILYKIIYLNKQDDIMYNGKEYKTND